jgi:phosphatidylinositol alpha-1,6-mannosyltransferase
MQSAREPKRVLLLFTEVFANGGIQRFNQTLLSALGELGVHCDILSMCDSRNSIGGNTLPRHMNFIGFGRGRVRFAAAMLRAICGGYYDWIVIGHVNLLVLAISALMTKPLRRTRTILIAHGIEVWYRMGVFRKLGLPLVSIVLCVSKYTRQRILDQVPVKDIPKRAGGITAVCAAIFPTSSITAAIHLVRDAIGEGEPL